MNASQPQIKSIKQPVDAEAALNVFFTLSQDLLCIRGKNGNFEHLNPAWEKVLGWNRSELLYMFWHQLVHPDDKEATIKAESLCNRENFVEYKNRYRHKDGSYRWLSWRVFEQEDGLLYGVAQDITTAKQSKETLYRASLQVLHKRFELEKLITNLSTKFIHLCLEEIDTGINDALQVIGEFAGFDYSYVVLFSEDYSVGNLAYSWSVKGNESARRPSLQFSTKSFSWGIEKLKHFEVIQSSTITDLPPEASNIKLAMHSSGTQSFVHVPMARGKSLIGCIGFASTKEKHCSDDTVALLKIVGEIFANALSRKQAEQKLQQAIIELTEWQNRYEAVGQISGQLLYDWNQQTEEFIWGRNAEKVLGYSREELKGGIAQINELVHPDDLKTKLQEFTQAIATKQPFHTEYRLRKKDGTYITVEDNGRFYPDSDGELNRMVGFIVDITKRKQAETALKESEERWQLALRANNDGIWDLNIKNNQVFYSARWKEMLGYAEHEVPNQSEEWTKRVHPDDLPWVSQACREHVEGKTPYFIAEYRMQCKDGSYKWILDRGQALRDQAGNLVRIIGSHTDVTERKQAEFALKESEERWQLALQGSNDGIWDWNIKTNQVFYSPRLREILGDEEHELTKDLDEWTTRIHPDDFDWVMQVHDEHLQRKTPYYSAEYRIQCKDGSYKWILDRGQALWDETGSPVRMVGSATDISDRKLAEAALQQTLLNLEQSVEERTQALMQANKQLSAEIAERQRTEAALRQSEELFRQMFDEAALGIALAYLDGSYFRVNPAFLNMLGYSEPELLALSFMNITHPEDLETEMLWVEQLIKGEIDSYTTEKRYLKKTQETLWVSLTCVAMRDQTGAVLYTLGMIEDITQRKQALEALQQSEARYRAIVEDQTEFVCRYQPDGTLTFVNDAYCRYFNEERSKLIGYNFLARIPKEDQELLMENIRSLSQAKPTIINEHQVILASGDIRWNQWIDRAVAFDEQGNVIEFQAVGRDITQLKQAEAEMQKALEKERELNELRSGFVSLVSHEFRTPLTTIQSSAELLERYSNRLSDEKKQNHLIRIQSSVSQMNDLIEEVLTIGKVEAGKLRFEPKLLDLVAFCRNIVETIQLSISHQHTLTFVTQFDSIDAQMDERLLGHIITNLLSNAIKYSPQGGTVKFHLICNSDSAIFRIQDNGIGIPSQELQHLFESFRRASNVGGIPGTGLGLAIVKNFVDLHKGQITVESEVGIGTTFTVTLPLN